MGKISRAGKAGKKELEKLLKEVEGALTATWTEQIGGTYDEFTGNYVGGVNEVKTLSIAAIMDGKGDEFKYAKYGIEISSDIMAMVSFDLEVPPLEAIYTKAGDPKKYLLKKVIPEGFYGMDSSGKQLFAYKLLHLRSTNG